MIRASSASPATRTQRAQELDSAVTATMPWIKIIMVSDVIIDTMSKEFCLK
jgi:hypothetical protein